MVDLLAGAPLRPDADSHRQIVEDMIRIFEAQRLINLDTIFEMAENLESVTKGEKLNAALVTKLAARIAEIQLPRASMSGAEKNSLAFGYWTERHVDQQRRMNLRAAVEKAIACERRRAASRSSRACWLPCFVTLWWDSTTFTMLRREHRSC